MRGAPVEVRQRVPLFTDLAKREVQQIARLFKKRCFAEGETVVQEGSGGAAFFVIESGEATVSFAARSTGSCNQATTSARSPSSIQARA